MGLRPCRACRTTGSGINAGVAAAVARTNCRETSRGMPYLVTRPPSPGVTTGTSLPHSYQSATVGLNQAKEMTMQTQQPLGIHQGTYDAVFQHPVARNLQWRD